MTLRHDDGEPLARLTVGTRVAGRGANRRDVDVVLTPEGREVARYDSTPFSESLAQVFVWGRDAARASGLDELADEWEVVAFRGGTPPFTATTHTVMRDGREMFVGKDAEQVAAWKAGWRHAMSEPGPPGARGRIRRSREGAGPGREGDHGTGTEKTR